MAIKRKRSARRFAARALLCASALGSGAGLAATTDLGRDLVPVAQAAPGPETKAAPKGDRPPSRSFIDRDPPPADLLARAAPEAPTSPQEIDFEDPLVFEKPAVDAMGTAYKDGMLISGSTPHRLLLFTFDDGPHYIYTPRLLDHLDEAGIRGIFFLTARRMRGDNARQRQHQEVAREIVRRGHMVGNHTLDHAQLPVLNDAEVIAQVEEAQAIFEDVLGERPWLFRHPGGARSERVDALIAERGYTSMLWNLGAGDFQVRNPEEVVETWKRVFERRRDEEGDRGGIVLLHDIHEWSVDALPLLVEHIRDRNCELLEKGEELFDIVDDPRFFFVPRGAARPHVSAPPAMPDPAILEARQARLREETRERCQTETTLAAR